MIDAMINCICDRVLKSNFCFLQYKAPLSIFYILADSDGQRRNQDP